MGQLRLTFGNVVFQLGTGWLRVSSFATLCPSDCWLAQMGRRRKGSRVGEG